MWGVMDTTIRRAFHRNVCVASNKISPETIRRSVAAVERHGGNITHAARELGIPRTTLADRVRGTGVRKTVSGGHTKVALDQSGGVGSLESLTDSIRTPEQLVEHADIDMSAWKIDRATVNVWEMGAKLPDGSLAARKLWQVKVSLRAIVSTVETDAIKLIADRFNNQKLRDFPRLSRRLSQRDCMLEVCVPDLHVGKLAWKPETGENYDVDIASRVYRHAVEHIVSLAPIDRIERVVLPIGNDLIHADNDAMGMGTTTNGTPMDVDGRLPRIIDRVVEDMTWSIDLLAGLSGSGGVDVVVVPGNHDRNAAQWLGRVLHAWYRGCKPVRVDISPTPRKYIRYGTNLIGYTHGCDEAHHTLESVMIGERPEDFTKCRVREWHLGHWHKPKETRYNAGDTHGGTVVRTISSLAGADRWHSRKGFVRAPKQAEGFVWQREGRYHTSIRVPPPEGAYA